FERSHASRSRGGDRLPIMAVGYVAADEYTRRPRTDIPLGNEIPIAIASQLLTHELCVRCMPDAQKHSTHRKVPLVASLQIAQPQSGDLLLADIQHVVHYGISE